MSSKSTPVLSHAISGFKKFMMQWESLGDQHDKLKPWADIGLNMAKKYYRRMDDTNVYVITMCKFVNEHATALTANVNYSSQPYCTLLVDQ
jgi:hypothetical protein